MCQAIVGKVVSVAGSKARVEIKGKTKIMDSQLANVESGDYVICAANYIIEKIDENEARAITGNVDADKK